VRRAVYLDRDGVINAAVVREGKPFPPASVRELIIPAETEPALSALSAAGFLLIGVTNQPDVRRGISTLSDVEAINSTLMSRLPLTTILTCFHDDSDHCGCRKPLPGLLTQAAEKYAIDLTNSFMVGDRWKDVEAGLRAGCVTVFLDRGYAEPAPANMHKSVTSLTGAVDYILSYWPSDGA
jgi:D-glycero-D-manno-heptose 1,7-bisphosphate phosphatase